MSELTPKEIEGYEAEAVELAKKHKVSKVHVYVGIDPETDERVVGFLKEPNYLQKIVTLDKIATVCTTPASHNACCRMREATSLFFQPDR